MQVQLYGREIWLYQEAIDFRCSIDGLCSLIYRVLGRNPQAGIYIFYNRSRDKLKCLSYHKNGFVLLYKRLDKEKFKFNVKSQQKVCTLSVEQLSWLLAGLEWEKMSQWKELEYRHFS